MFPLPTKGYTEWHCKYIKTKIPFDEIYAMKSSIETKNDSSGTRKSCVSIMCFKVASVELKTWPQKIHSLVGMSLK